jgi:hypothetical protein
MQDKNLSPIHLFRGFKKLGEDQGQSRRGGLGVKDRILRTVASIGLFGKSI